MEEDRYKRLTTLFINRVDTLEMMRVFDGKEKIGLKVFKNDGYKYYHYMFMQPMLTIKRSQMFDDLEVTSRKDGQEIRYELCLNKHRNEAVLIYNVHCGYFFSAQEYTTRAAMRIFKSHGFEKYTYDQQLKMGINNAYIKVKAIIDESIPLSEVFDTMDQLEKLSVKSVYQAHHHNFNDFFNSIFNEKEEV